MKRLVMIAAVFMFWVGNAWAAPEWNFYGSVRVSTFYSNWSDNMFGQGGNPILGTGPHTKNFEEDLNGNARVGARVKISDTLTGRFEYGAKKGNANLRILWGEWDFGAGSLGVGQNYTPLLFPYSNQVYNIYAIKEGDTNMSRFGMLYGQREPMIRLKFGSFQIAAVQPRELVHHDWVAPGTPGSTAISATLAIPGSQPTTEVKFPNIQAKYRIDFDWGHLNLAGGYQSFDVVDSGKSYNVSSYLLALGWRVNVGNAYFKGDFWGGQNVGNLANIFTGKQAFSTVAGVLSAEGDGASVGLARWRDGSIAGTTDGITNNDALAGLLVAGLKIRRGLYVEAGYGYTQTDLNEGSAEKDDHHAWYAQSTIFLAENVFVTPEIGGFDAGSGESDVLYFGAKWQINF